LVREITSMTNKKYSPELKVILLKNALRRGEKKLNIDMGILLKDNIFIEKKDFTRGITEVINLKKIAKVKIYLN